MNSDLREQMYNELNLRETEDLLEIWWANDREEWSDTAFEVIKEILLQRLGEIPARATALVGEDGPDDEGEESADADGLDKWEAKALDDENQPEFYDTLEVITLKDNLNKTAKAVIVVNALVGLTNFRLLRSIVEYYFPYNGLEFRPLTYLVAFVLMVVGTAVQIAIVYFPLKALLQILRILMEMEFRSRKGI